jgi:hypothetical protein
LAFATAQDISDTVTLANAAIPTVSSLTDTATTTIQDTIKSAAPAVSEGWKIKSWLLVVAIIVICCCCLNRNMQFD